MNQQRFDALAQQGHNRIPVFREVFADMDTPLSVYLKLADAPYAYLLESVEGGEQWGRYSIIGLPCREVIKVYGHELAHEHDGREISRGHVENPLESIKRLRAGYHVPRLPELPPFCGGLVGYFGYETIAYIEPKLAHVDKPDQLNVPDITLLVSEELAVFDNLSGKLFIIVNVDPSMDGAWTSAQRRLDQLVYRLRAPSHGYPEMISPDQVGEADFVSGFTQQGFEDAVRRSKEYIVAGDIMQVVLSQRMSVPFKARPVDVYRALRAMNPSPYMYFFDLGETQVVGSSPEILMRVEDGEVVVRPIAGTRPRGATADEDKALETELLNDPKELAEHLMLIDLGRNDVGRVAQVGGVELTEQMIIERYSHVMHIVSEVRGKLREDTTPMDVLAATFPAGTLSGAPKIRAMEIIAELEPVKRNVYAGAVGYIGWWGDADTAIAIRTAVIKDGQLHVQAGAGIVHDSDPTKEWEETMNKGRALFRAVAQAAGGL